MKTKMIGLKLYNN